MWESPFSRVFSGPEVITSNRKWRPFEVDWVPLVIKPLQKYKQTKTNNNNNNICVSPIQLPVSHAPSCIETTNPSWTGLNPLNLNTLRPRQYGRHFKCGFFMKIYQFLLIFHWSLFLRVQSTISQHWFGYCPGNDQATSYYLNQWCSVYWRIYASLGLNELLTLT